MFKFVRDDRLRAFLFCLVSLLPFLMSEPVIGFAKSPPMALTRSGFVKIDGKTRNAIIIIERHFTVTESTTILDVHGKKIQLDDLPTPCKAKIMFRLRMDQDPETLKVVVKEVFPHSNTAWSPQGHK